MSEVKYDVVIEQNLSTLIILVNHKLREGWQLQGGISCSISESNEYYYPVYCQAMIKQDSSEPATFMFTYVEDENDRTN